MNKFKDLLEHVFPILITAAVSFAITIIIFNSFNTDKNNPKEETTDIFKVGEVAPSLNYVSKNDKETMYYAKGVWAQVSQGIIQTTQMDFVLNPEQSILDNLQNIYPELNLDQCQFKCYNQDGTKTIFDLSSLWANTSFGQLEIYTENSDGLGINFILVPDSVGHLITHRESAVMYNLLSQDSTENITE